MASVFKKARDRQRKGASWYIAYTDETGRRVMVKGCPDKAATEAMARKLESDAELRRRGIIDPKADSYAAHEAKPLATHLDDFHACLIAKGNTAKHANLSRTRIKRVVDLTRARRISELSPSGVQAALAGMRAEGRSLETLNHHVRAVKGFSRWLWRDGRTPGDALAVLTLYNAATDRRHDRRALSEAEAAALILTAERGGPAEGMSGPNRAMLYRVALGTGFRAGELASLTPESFDLTGPAPTVTVAAAYSKRRRDDVQPIRPDMAAVLRPWLAAKPAGQPVFATMPTNNHTARMLRVDLAAAGIPYRDASGRVADFHALRATYITLIVRGGASVKTAQSLARHASPVLTIGRYAHVALHDQTSALDALPATAPEKHGPEAATLAPTGTDGRAPAAHGQRAGDGTGRIGAVAGGFAYGLGGEGRGTQPEDTGGVVRLGAGTGGRGAGRIRTGGGGFAIRWPVDGITDPQIRLRRQAPRPAAHGQRAGAMPADLAIVVECWAELPEAIRAGIVAMVQAAGRGSER